MSKRTSFTSALSLLLLHMDANKDRPVLDFVKRSKEEQKRLYEEGKTECDGERQVSRHQVGLAADVYLLTPEGGLVDWKEVPGKVQEYHTYWEVLGGKPVVPWDLGHFEF